ncbi:hypothetical protein [Streptomyces sp. CRN 30]|uniref:hypothetical protein n=1 Tax=Streptomyces sp. CRN 30 TaxID=3075613 RepID=UPI002A812AA0|nr:hypothetical protein [Streptomyces sp. CRN 30]
MTAERKGTPDGRAPDDALMAAILGEPLPPDSAEAADVAALRERLRMIGDALGEPPPPPEPVPARPAARPRPRRRPLSVALGALAVACAAAVLGGGAWLLTQAGGGYAEDSGAGVEAGSKAAGGSFGDPRYLACARLVAEATVTAAEAVPGADAERITVRVTRAYAPRDGAPDEAVFLVEESPGRPAVGDRVLFGLSPGGEYVDELFVGGKEIAPQLPRLLASAAEARALTCD